MIILLSFVSIVLFGIYIFLKIKKHHPLFTPFSINTYITSFCLLIMPIFFQYDAAWYALGIKKAAIMKEYLQYSIIINDIGFIIFIIFVIKFEFFKSNNFVLKKTYKLSRKINANVLFIFFIPCVAIWYYIVFKYNHGIPLFNGERTFYKDYAISPIYLGLNEIFRIFALYYGVIFVTKKKKIIPFVISSLTVLFQGNRGSFLLNILVVVGILYVYKRRYLCFCKYEYNSQQAIKMRTKENLKILFILIIVLFLGLSLSFIRKGDSFSFETTFVELIYGNTFSDIRDGALIVKGFMEKYNNVSVFSLRNNYVYGLTLLSGIISFVPSSILNFRKKWSWGSFSTFTLLNMENHIGLRGGNSMEAYVNFGLIGIIIFAALYGYFVGSLEKWYQERYILVKDSKFDLAKEFIIVQLFSSFSNLFACSASFFNFYVDVVFLIVILFLSKFMEVKNENFINK